MNKNDLYYNACDAYSDWVRTGLIGFKNKSDRLFALYKSLGGKRTAVHYISPV